MRLSRARHLRATLAVTAATATVLAGTAVSGGGGASAAPSSAAVVGDPVVRVLAPADEVDVDKWGHSVYFSLGTYLVAGYEPFRVETTRASWWDEPVTRVVRAGDDLVLPARMTGFGALPDFARTVIRDARGHKILDRTTGFCLNHGSVRTDPDAPDTSESPSGCRGWPFMIGQVQLLERGWGARWPTSRVRDVPVGHYTARVRITEAWRDLLDLPLSSSRASLDVHVTRSGDCRGCRRPARHDDATPPGPQPRAVQPSTGAAPPAGTPLPDLRSLPSFGIQVHRSGNFLIFGANVWNAGPSPLVVDGFRRQGEDVMDAYQYFYDTDGNPVGHARTGEMEWDDRDGHNHWHFRDFASYRLLDEDKVAVARSKKEAFCLAATDAVDYTVPGAEWDPWNTDLHTACGSHDALGVREVLPVGSGDTYGQYRPGQSFNLHGLRNGTYFVEVTANPQRNLYEADYDNNTAYRRIRLGGRPDHRTVHVFRKGLIDWN